MCLGIPGQVVGVADPLTHLAPVLVSGTRRRVDLSLFAAEDEEGEDAPLKSGEWVLVHAGLALARISAEEAREILALQREMSDLRETFVAESGAESAQRGLSSDGP